MNLARTMHLSRRSEEGNKLDFSIRAAFPVTVISKNYDSGETTTETWTNSFQDMGEVNYDYRQETQSARTEPATGVYGRGVILPEINISRHTVDLEITRKPVELTLSASPGKGKGSTIRFKNTITVGGVECSRLFKVHRLERDWFHMYDPAGKLTSWEVVNDWHDVTDDGNLAAEREVSFESYFPPKSPRSAWGHRLYVGEFLDCVERLPELGFLHHVVTLETHIAGETRIEITARAAEVVSAYRWCEIFEREEFDIGDVLSRKKLTQKKLQ